MHVDNSSYTVEIGVQGKCIINCRQLQIVQVMHAVKERPNGVAQFKLGNFLITRGLIPKETMQGNRSLESRKIG